LGVRHVFFLVAFLEFYLVKHHVCRTLLTFHLKRRKNLTDELTCHSLVVCRDQMLLFKLWKLKRKSGHTLGEQNVFFRKNNHDIYFI
jgi:hypothetical protein